MPNTVTATIYFDFFLNSYAVIMEWIESNGHEIAKHPRESFIDGIWNKEDPADWLTEIQIPIK